MTRIEADFGSQQVVARHWLAVPSRTVAGVLLSVFLLNALFLLLAGDSNASNVVFRAGLLHPFLQLLTGSVTLIALSTLAVAVWSLVLLNRKVEKASITVS
jgi:hypothetical protein